MKKKILIIGTLPPPVGGVTIHVQRLLGMLDCSGISYTFADYNRKPFSVFLKFFTHKVIHLHLSNIYVSLLFAIVCFVFRKKLIITRHGDICRNSGFKRKMDLLCIKLTYQPIVLNMDSFSFAIQRNPATKLQSSFLPPTEKKDLPVELMRKLNTVRNKYKYIFATNAYNLAFDSFGNELYGISCLIELFKKLPDHFLFAATCNGKYLQYLTANNVVIPDNVCIIDYPIDFYTMLNFVDGMIRHTTTDGDALSVREGLYLGTKVFATDCVKRPQGTICYHDLPELESYLVKFSELPPINNANNCSSAEEITQLYSSLLAEQ